MLGRPDSFCPDDKPLSRGPSCQHITTYKPLSAIKVLQLISIYVDQIIVHLLHAANSIFMLLNNAASPASSI